MIRTLKYSYEWNDSQNCGHINSLAHNDITGETYWRHRRNSNGWYTIKDFETFEEICDFAEQYKPNN